MPESSPKLFDAKTKILIVEDDKFFSDLLSRKFSESGASVLHAGTGEDAMKMLVEEVPNFIILDVLLPGIDGFEVLRRIKADSRLNKIPVAILSNFASAVQIEEGKKLGAVDYFIKATVTPNEIVKTISALVPKK